MIENKLYEYMAELLKRTPLDFIRYKYDEINWNGRLIGIMGPRGVGKTTMILQRIRLSREGHHLYVSADNIYFSNHSLVDFADEFIKEGGTHLYIDEIHKYAGWSRELKQIYDMHPSLTRVFSLDEILNHQVEIPGVEHPLPFFRAYLDHGYYPFAIEGDFTQRMLQVIDQTVEVDIPQYADMKASTARKLKRMLIILSGLAPYKPSVENLATEIGVSKNNVPDYLVYLERAGMIVLLRDDTSGMRNLGKVEKVYVDNPSLMSVLTPNPNIGNIRETFFYNQMREKQDVISSRVSDFTIGDYTFEIGGRKKGKKQIEDVKNGRIVKDDIETGHGIIIPLWYFGMNY